MPQTTPSHTHTHTHTHTHQEASFRAFLARPENRPLVEEQQRLEVAGALALQEQEREARLRAQVGPEPAACLRCVSMPARLRCRPHAPTL